MQAWHTTLPSTASPERQGSAVKLSYLDYSVLFLVDLDVLRLLFTSLSGPGDKVERENSGQAMQWE